MKTTKIKSIKKTPFKGKVYNMELQSSREEDDLFWVDQGTGIVSHNCFRKDLLNLVYLCRSFGLDEAADYWEQVEKMNQYQKHRFSDKIISSMFNTVAGKKIAIFGYAFKANTGDTRETPALDVVKHLKEEHADVVITDPQALEECFKDICMNGMIPDKGVMTMDVHAIDNRVFLRSDPYTAAEGAHAIAVCTDWEEYKHLDWKKIYASMEKPAFVFDGRIMLDHTQLRKIGFEVCCIGR